MVIEEKVFQKKRINLAKLLKFGFQKEGAFYSYETSIMDENFTVIVAVSVDNLENISGRVIDNDLGEDYLGFRVKAIQGSFSGHVLESYENVLKKIADECCDDFMFNSPQANRIQQWIKESFEDNPIFAFEKYPEIATFRYEAKKKWYGLMMPVKKKVLDTSFHPISIDELEETVEILLVKLPPEDVEELLHQDGIFPAYHMNKKHWLTLLLDGSLPDDQIYSWISQSRQLVVGSTGPFESNYWVIPANPKYYDIDQEFREHSIIKWTQKAGMKKGDIVLIYMTQPMGFVRYICRVLESDIENDGYRDQSSIKKLMRIEKLKILPDQAYPLQKLKEYGVSTIRGPRHLPKGLVKAVKEELK